MNPLDFMLHVLDPVDISRWPLRGPAFLIEVHERMRAFLDGKFSVDNTLAPGTPEYEVQRYFIRMVRRIIIDLERKFQPRIRAIAAYGDSDADIMMRIIKCLEMDSTGTMLIHVLYDEFFQKYLEKAKKIDYKNPMALANDMFIKTLAGSFEQASLFLRTECAHAGIEVHNI